MKKIIFICSIFLFLSLNLNTIPSFASPAQKTFSQGIYRMMDLNLLPNVAYTAQNVYPTEVFLIIFDGSKVIQQSIRLEGNSIHYVLRPMKEDFNFVVLGNGQLVFTPTNITP